MIAPPHVPVSMEKKPPTMLVMPGGYDGGVGGEGGGAGGNGSDGGDGGSLLRQMHVSYERQVYEFVTG